MNPLIHRYAVYGSPEPIRVLGGGIDDTPLEWRGSYTADNRQGEHITLVYEAGILNSGTQLPLKLRVLRNTIT